MTRSVTWPRVPLITIRRWRRARQRGIDRASEPIESRSGMASVADQLILMSTISPRGRCKAPISSGSSPDTEAECGHHAPSMSPPRTRAKLIRTGRAHRRAPADPFTIFASQSRHSEYLVGPKRLGIRRGLPRLRTQRRKAEHRGGKTGPSCSCGVLSDGRSRPIRAVDGQPDDDRIAGRISFAMGNNDSL